MVLYAAFVVAPAHELSNELLRHDGGLEPKAHQFCYPISGAYCSPGCIIRLDADEQVAWEEWSLHRRKLTSLSTGPTV